MTLQQLADNIYKMPSEEQQLEAEVWLGHAEIRPAGVHNVIGIKALADHGPIIAIEDVPVP